MAKDKERRRAYQREWERKNRDKINATHRSRSAIYEARRNKELRNEQRRANYQKNLEKHRQRARDYAASHKVEAKVRSTKWYLANKTRALELAKAYVKQDPEKWREYFSRYHQRNREHREQQNKVWRQNNVEAVRAMGHKATLTRRARKRKVFVEAIDPRTVFERDGGICGICKREVDVASNWEVDHIVPISKGGLHAYANVQLSHRKCNRSKAARVA